MVMHLRGGDNVSYELDALRRDVSKLTQDLGILAQRLMGAAKERSETLKSSAGESLSDLRDYAGHRPVSAALLALGLGVILGAAFGALSLTRGDDTP